MQFSPEPLSVMFQRILPLMPDITICPEDSLPGLSGQLYFSFMYLFQASVTWQI